MFAITPACPPSKQPPEAPSRSQEPRWFGTYAETIRRSPHAAELLDAKHRLSADLVTDAARRYQRLVRDVLAEAAADRELDAVEADPHPPGP